MSSNHDPRFESLLPGFDSKGAGCFSSVARKDVKVGTVGFWGLGVRLLHPFSIFLALCHLAWRAFCLLLVHVGINLGGKKTCRKRQKGKELVKFMETTTLCPDCALGEHPKSNKQLCQTPKIRYFIFSWNLLNFN